MPPFDHENTDLYNLISKGIPRHEIDRVYKNLRARGYGEEEALRRSKAVLSRMKAQRDMEEARGKTARRGDKGTSEPMPVDTRSGGKSLWPGRMDSSLPRRRAVDWVPPLPPRLRRKINRWAFRRGLRIARLPERLSDFLSIFDKRRKDYVSREFLQILGERRGYLSNPFEYSFIDALDALRHSSRRLLGGERPMRRLAERQKAKDIQKEVELSLRVREPFALDFFGLFAESHEMLRRSLAYVEASLKTGLRMEVPALARVVKDGYRLILMTEGVEFEEIEALFDVVKEVNLVHDRANSALAELSEAEVLFRAAFQQLPVFKRELYPALLKMIAEFHDEFDNGRAKMSRIYAFLEIKEDMVLTYDGYQKRLAEVREKALKEQQQEELEKLEQEKQEMFSYRFEGTLSTLSTLFPASQVEKMEQGEYVLPYFMNRVFSKSPAFQRHAVDLESLPSGDVMGLIIVVHMIVDDLLDSVNPYALERILFREGLGDAVVELRENWKSVYTGLFEPYLDEIHELARETSGDPRYVKLFRESLRARSIEERVNALRNHAIKNFGHMLSERDISDAPRLFDLAEKLEILLTSVGDSINPDLLDAEDALRKKLVEDLAIYPVVDFDARSRVGSDDYRPVTRQVRRYIEARYRQDAARNPPLAQIVFFDVFRGIADLYSYLLNDHKSFAAQSSHAVLTAGEGEHRAWTREKEERGRESALLLQGRLIEDFPGQFLDGLTGLKNKNYFLTELPKRTEKMRAEGKPLTLMMIDIDHFKWINDELGHQDGDEVLSATAEMILDNVREGDIAVRYGGEEILLVLPSDLHTGIVLAERLRFTQEQNLSLKGAFIGVKLIWDDRKEPCGTLSIGVAEAGEIPDIGEAVARADKALYAAKKGRNAVFFLDPKKPKEEPFTSYEDYMKKPH